MKDPLDIVDQRLRDWVTPELVKAVLGDHDTSYPDGPPDCVCFELLPTGGLLIRWTSVQPHIAEYQIFVDPTQPWPPQPTYQFGDHVTHHKNGKSRHGVITANPVMTAGRCPVSFRDGGQISADPADLTPGWD